jgi:hypothetical protein
MEQTNKFGLSKKTNIAIASIAGIGVVKDALPALIAIVLITLVAITYQFIIDRFKNKSIV